MSSDLDGLKPKELSQEFSVRGDSFPRGHWLCLETPLSRLGAGVLPASSAQKPRTLLSALHAQDGPTTEKDRCQHRHVLVLQAPQERLWVLLSSRWRDTAQPPPSA